MPTPGDREGHESRQGDAEQHHVQGEQPTVKKKEVYHLVTVDNGETDAASILSIFSEMETGHLRSDIRLLNYYHEVPVNYGATIASIDDDSVELSIHENQAIVIKQDKSTLINSVHFPKDLGVHCYASYVNVSKKTVILNNFSYFFHILLL